MKIATGKVVEGRVVVEGATLDEGATVTVLARDDDESFELSSEQEVELLLAIEEAERGETISANELLQNLRRRT